MTTTFNLEEPMRLGASHLESLVDERGRTYFNVFRTHPAEAVFDWPDFVDLPARYIEAAVMIEPALGRSVRTLPALKRWLFSHVEADGLAYRPDGPISDHQVELFDQSRYLYMLCSLAMADPQDADIRARLRAACRGLKARATVQDDYAYIHRIEVYFGGTLIRPMVQAGLILHEPEWIDFAGALGRAILYHSDHHDADGAFKGHHHGHLSTQAGLIAYAHITGDRPIRDRVRQIFDWSRSISRACGFVPEVASREDDIQVCETCTLMDYLDTALLLARHVDESYWDVVEKAARNHLVEAQIRNADWLEESADVRDEEDILRTDIRRRVQGSFAGWAAPHAALGVAEEQQQSSWVKSEQMRPRYWHKVRALQNCCAGAGIRALHQVWSNLAVWDGEQLSVNLLVDKELPQARITSFIPYEGLVRVEMRHDGRVRVRLPAGITPQNVTAAMGGRNVDLTHRSGFVSPGRLRAGQTLEVRLPLPERTEEFTIGNRGFQQYRFRAEWKGDTILRMDADPSNADSGLSHVMRKRIPVYYGPDAPGRFYQRRDIARAQASPERSVSACDDGRIDWYSLKSK